MEVYVKVFRRGVNTWARVETYRGLTLDTMGPFRDSTDTENAVMDRAETEGWDVRWE